MNKEKDKKYTPILPFDITIGENFYMYDHITYHQNISLCGKDTIQLESGNIIKYYHCNLKPPYSIGGD